MNGHRHSERVGSSSEPRQVIPVALLFVLVVLAATFLANMLYLEFVLMYFVSYFVYTGSWDLLYSYSGQLSLGHAIPFGVGSLVAVTLTARLGLVLPLSVVAGAVVASGIGGTIGSTTTKLREGYQGIALLLFSQVLFWLVFIFLGEEGVSIYTTIDTSTVYFMGIMIFALSFVALDYIETSKYATRLLAIKGDKLLAEVIGLRVLWIRSSVFYISSAFAGLAGALFGMVTLHVDYTVFAVAASFTPIGMAIVGGMGSLGGTLLGSALVVMLLNLLPLWLSLPATYLIYGLIVILILKVRPKGLVDLLKKPRGGRT